MQDTMGEAEAATDMNQTYFPAFDTLVAAAGVDELLAAREKASPKKDESGDESRQFRADQLHGKNLEPEAPGSWRLTFGGGSIATEMTAACKGRETTVLTPLKKVRPPGMKAEESPFGRGSRRRGARTLGARTVSQAAIDRRKIKDLEAGEDVMAPGGFAENRVKKRAGEDGLEWEEEEVNGNLPKRTALMAYRGDKGEDEMELEGDGTEEDADWKPQSRPRSIGDRKLRRRSDSLQLLPVDDGAAGRRRRGRPPGSGNRKPMEPQRVGPDGTKQFNLRSARFTGVYRTPAGRWRAQFCHRGQVVQLGMYDNEDAAARRWDMEAIRLRGTSTQLNFTFLKPVYLKQLERAEKYNVGYDVDLSDQMLLDAASAEDGMETTTVAIEDFAGALAQLNVPGDQARDPRRRPSPEIADGTATISASPVPLLPSMSGGEVMDGDEGHASDPWAALVSAAVPDSLEGTKVVPETVLGQVKTMLEGIVKAADKDIQMTSSRMTNASQIIHYGECMRREAEVCLDLYNARRDAASKLLDKFEVVLTTSGGDERAPDQNASNTN